MSVSTFLYLDFFFSLLLSWLFLFSLFNLYCFHQSLSSVSLFSPFWFSLICRPSLFTWWTYVVGLAWWTYVVGLAWWTYVVGLAGLTSMLWLSLQLCSNIVSVNVCLLKTLSFKSWFLSLIVLFYFWRQFFRPDCNPVSSLRKLHVLKIEAHP